MISLTRRIGRLKASAKQRNIEVRLMNYEYDNLLKMGCHYCGKDLKDETGYCLDRLDSNKGYTLHNVVPCCKQCNYGKHTMGFDTFIEWIYRVHDHSEKVMEFLKTQPQYVTTYQDEKLIHKEHNTLANTYCIKVKVK